MAEVHFLTYDPEAMWKEMHLAYMDAGGDPLYPGDEKEMLLRGMMAILMQSYAAFDHAARMQTLRYAQGEYLDLIGEKRGISRIEAVAAEGEITIVVKPGITGHTLAAGTMFTDGARVFQLAEGVAVPAGASNVTITKPVICTELGTAGNGMPEGTVLYPIQQDPKIISVTMTKATRGGVDREEDEAYRERIRTSGNAATGSKEAYESKAKAVSANIIDAKARFKSAGVVEVNLLLADGLTEAEENELIAQVLEALNDQDARPIADAVEVKLAEVVPYTLNIVYSVAEASAENMAILLQQAADEYQAWQEGAVGRTFDPFRLISMLYAAGATMAQWDEASEIDGQPVARTAIQPYECLKGTITLTKEEGE